MINTDATRRIEQLESEYEDKWGKKVDCLIIPQGITQEKLVSVLERIVDTGESILVGWNKTNNRE